LPNKRINEVFGSEFLSSNFWLYWRTMWHSALEMKLYLHRFIHQIKGMPDFSTLKFTKYNQYESLVDGATDNMPNLPAGFVADEKKPAGERAFSWGRNLFERLRTWR
jgi:myosin-crossreactive antigen